MCLQDFCTVLHVYKYLTKSHGLSHHFNLFKWSRLSTTRHRKFEVNRFFILSGIFTYATATVNYNVCGLEYLFELLH